MYQRILVPIDGSATSECALDEAGKFAQQQNAQGERVHVLEDIRYLIVRTIWIMQVSSCHAMQWRENADAGAEQASTGRGGG